MQIGRQEWEMWEVPGVWGDQAGVTRPRGLSATGQARRWSGGRREPEPWGTGGKLRSILPRSSLSV